MAILTLRSPSAIAVRGPEVLKWRRDHKTWVEGAEFTPAYNQKVDHSKKLTDPGNRRWDGFWYPGDRFLASTETLYCKYGLLKRLMGELTPTLENQLVPPGIPRFGGLIDPVRETLRDYQLQALGMMAHERWGRIAMATNAGKGAIIALFAAACQRGGLQTLILCDELSVFQALHDEIVKWAGWPPGVITAGEKTIPIEPVVLAMVPTLARRVAPITKTWREKAPAHKVVERTQEIKDWTEWLGKIHVLLMDEADKSTAATWQRIIDCCENTYWRIGFSGTFPEQGSLADMQQEEYLGQVLMRKTNAELVEAGISARPSVFMHPFRHHFPRNRKASNWDKLLPMQKRLWVYDEAVTYNVARHGYVASLLLPEAINVIVVRRIEHGENLAQYLNRQGFDVPFMQGSWSPEQRTAVLDQLENGSVTTIIVTSILDRGTNKLGWATNLIFASGEGSDRQTLQRVGRGLRRNGGKEYVDIHDVMDHGHKFLETAVRKRIALYNDEGFEISIVKEGSEKTEEAHA